MAEIGDNSVASKELRSLVERIERLEEEKKGIADDIKDVYALGKSQGYDTKMLRQLIRIRKLKKGEYEEQQMVLETYLVAIGYI